MKWNENRKDGKNGQSKVRADIWRDSSLRHPQQVAHFPSDSENGFGWTTLMVCIYIDKKIYSYLDYKYAVYIFD